MPDHRVEHHVQELRVDQVPFRFDDLDTKAVLSQERELVDELLAQRAHGALAITIDDGTRF